MLTFVILDKTNNQALTKYRTKPNVNTIILGGSQIQMSINDHLLTNSVNLSLDAESYQFAYYKLKGIVKNNPNVKKLYLGCGYFYFSTFYDEYIFGKHSKDFFGRYFFILPLKEKGVIIKHNLNDLSGGLKTSLHNGIKNSYCDQNNLSFIGLYKNGFVKTAATKKSINNRLNVQFYDEGKLRGFSENNSYYLPKIIELCRQNKVELTLISPPLHPYYKKRIPQKFIKKFNYIMAKNKLTVIDLSSILLNDSCYLPDGSHVTEYGAKLTTEILSERIKNMNNNSKKRKI